jgi:hypothetical protein
MNNYDWLISRLDAFIRKYYANRLIRGSLVLLSCLLFYILTISVGEYFLYLPVAVKVTLVSLFVLLGGTALVVWVIIPITKMAKMGKVISHEQAAEIVGRHFPEISDKLLNILQLKRTTDVHESRELVEASIDQKAAQLSVIPITHAVDLTKNRRYLRYLLPLLLVGVFILVAAPNVFKEASARLLQPTKEFERPAPFQFIISQPLKAVRNTDYTLKVEVKGDVLPADMAMALGDDRVPMQATGQHIFTYTFRNVTDNVQFRLFAAGFYSQPYTLSVVQKPVLKSFKVGVNYPDYTGRKDEELTSLGDMTLPVGTYVNLAFVAEYTDMAAIRLAEGEAMPILKQANMFASQYRFMNDTSFTLILRNKQSGVADSFQYHVKVIPDQYPVIQMQEYRDTVSGKQILLTGTAGDDYAISKLLFHYQVTDAKNKELANKSVVLPTSSDALNTFQHYFDIETLKMQPGQKVSYYVEAWDNDGVHGSKASRSEVMMYHMYTPDQIDSAINENAEQINSGLSNSAQQTKQLQDQYREMQSKMLQTNSMDWEQQQSVQQIAKLQEQLQNKMDAMKKRFEEQVQQSKQKEYSQDIKDKQEELKKQMDNLLNKELAEQMKKLEELMKQLNKDKAFETMKQLEQDNKLFNMDLQRMQELMKQLEMQMRLEDMANKMDELAKKQMELKAQTDKKAVSNEELAKKQDELKKELEAAMEKEMKEMEELNKQMKKEQDIDEAKQDAKEAGEEMEKSEEQLEQSQGSKSSQSQQNAAQKMQNASKKMSAMAGGMGAMQIDIDIKATRQILTNLMRLSFDQEQLMKKVQNTSTTSQLYVANQKEQKRLHANSRMIRDSLFVLSKRVFQLAATVNKETTELEKNLSAALDELEQRSISDALTRQQYAMTHTNNLALMLNEVLSNLMQMQAQSQQPGEGSCNKPGGMKPKPGAGNQLSDIITKQQQMGDVMQQMKNAQQRRKGQGNNQQGEGQEGGQEGNQKEGKDGKPNQSGKIASGTGEYGNAEQLARMAEQQAAIRRQLQELASMLNSKGLSGAKELKELQEQMDRNETDLVNRRLTSEMQMRQQEILTRLLKAEKSIREQEQDDKRSSESAKEISRNIPPELQRYIKDRQQLLELYRTVPPQLKPYYKAMVEQYYQMIGNK